MPIDEYLAKLLHYIFVNAIPVCGAKRQVSTHFIHSLIKIIMTYLMPQIKRYHQRLIFLLLLLLKVN